MSIQYQHVSAADISLMLGHFAFVYHYVLSQPQVNGIRGS